MAKRSSKNLGFRAPPSASAQPFLTRIDGKRALLPELLPLIPAFPGAYHQPFLGDAALFFEAHNHCLLQSKRIFLSDIRGELANVYAVVRDDVDALVARLAWMGQFSDREAACRQLSQLDTNLLCYIGSAALFLYLSQLCTNGFRRLNHCGLSYSSFDYLENPNFFDEDVLRADSRALQDVEISCADFRASLQTVRSGDFVYLDSPYFGVFDKYTSRGFPLQDHEDLAVEFERLTTLGAYVLMSNSSSDWVRERYAAFRQVQVMAPRRVNSNGKGRGPVSELIIVGWEPADVAAVPASAGVAS